MDLEAVARAEAGQQPAGSSAIIAEDAQQQVADLVRRELALAGGREPARPQSGQRRHEIDGGPRGAGGDLGATREMAAHLAQAGTDGDVGPPLVALQDYPASLVTSGDGQLLDQTCRGKGA